MKFCYVNDLKDYIANQEHENKPVKCPSCSKESDINAVEGCFQECLEKQLLHYSDLTKYQAVKLRYPNVRCSLCSEEFDIADFKAHGVKCRESKDVDEGEAKLVCLLCRKSYPSTAHTAHMKSHIDEVCGKKKEEVATRTATQNGRKTSYVAKKTTCPYCQEEFNCAGTFFLHRKIKHFWGKFKCSKCLQIYPFAADVVHHMRSSQHDEEGTVACPACKDPVGLEDIASHFQSCVVDTYRWVGWG